MSAHAYSGPAPSEEARRTASRALLGTVAYLAPRIQNHLASRPPGRSGCAAQYSRLFDKPTLDVRIAYGYSDWIDLERSDRNPRDREAANYSFLDSGTRVSLGYNGSNDLFVGMAAYQALIRPCPRDSDVEACGFEPTNSYLELQKTVRARDGSGRRTQVVVKLAYSSLTPFFELNRSPEYLASQRQQSERAGQVFFGGLRQADLVFYSGHARYGGGPDFNPPVIDEATRHPVMAYYASNQPGVRAMRAALDERRRTGDRAPFMIGVFACNSNRPGFADVIRSLAPGSRLAFATGITSANYESQAAPLVALDGVLRQRCSDEIAASLNEFERGARNRFVTFEPK